MGPLISAGQRDRVAAYVPDDAPVAIRGRAPSGPGFWYPPIVLAPVDPSSAAWREEIFGPVVAVVPFDDEAEAVAAANDSVYGLAAAVWTRDLSRSHRLAKQLQAGTVWLNAQFAWDPAMPFGGHKQSGWGYEYGLEGVESYMQTKAVYTGI
jgi:acyl-CoA reductase-like NAD-dependent aldehyde dehydrogenase